MKYDVWNRETAVYAGRLQNNGNGQSSREPTASAWLAGHADAPPNPLVKAVGRA